MAPPGILKSKKALLFGSFELRTNGHGKWTCVFRVPHFPWAACVSASVCKVGYRVALPYCSDMDVTASPWVVNGKAFCETLCELIIPRT